MNLQLEFRKITPFGNALKIGLNVRWGATDIQADFEINRPVRYQITAKRNYFHRRRTDGQTSRKTTIGSFFFRKIKKY